MEHNRRGRVACGPSARRPRGRSPRRAGHRPGGTALEGARGPRWRSESRRVAVTRGAETDPLTVFDDSENVVGTYLRQTRIHASSHAEDFVVLYLRPKGRFLLLGYWLGYERSSAAGCWSRPRFVSPSRGNRANGWLRRLRGPVPPTFLTGSTRRRQAPQVRVDVDSTRIGELEPARLERAIQAGRPPNRCRPRWPMVPAVSRGSRQNGLRTLAIFDNQAYDRREWGADHSAQ